MANILIVDDDAVILNIFQRILNCIGHEVTTAAGLAEGLQLAETNNFDVVFLDVRLSDGSGLEALPRFRTGQPPSEVIVITGAGDADGAESALRSGAWDYLQKPVGRQALLLVLQCALNFRASQQERDVRGSMTRTGIVGESPAIHDTLDHVARAARSDISVLVTGETGTGKELLARAIHENSRRAGRPFVVVDCTALPETLVASMLFGHRRGAFTGADENREGLAKQADGGTLFLDEAGDLPPAIQGTFLRVLQERRFRPLGAAKEETSDFRLVAATNRDLEQLAREGAFREDLRFRIAAFHIEAPPLRERREDIRIIAEEHLRTLSERHGVREKRLAPDFVRALEKQDWPGNVRELLQTVERAFTSGIDEPVLILNHLPLTHRVRAARDGFSDHGSGSPRLPTFPDDADAAGGDGGYEHPDGALATDRVREDFRSPSPPTLKEARQRAVARAEHEYLRDLMTHTGGDMEEACRVAGLSRSRLYHLLSLRKVPTPPQRPEFGIGIEDGADED